MSRIQAAVLASCAPLVNLWAQVVENGFSGKPGELIPTKDVLRDTRDTLALIGNASSYISHHRRLAIVDKVEDFRPYLASFLKEVCLENVGDTEGDLFGPGVKKKIMNRADTLKAFNEAPAKKPWKSRKSFFGEELGGQQQYK